MHARGSAGMEKRSFQLCTLRGNFHKAVFVFVVAGGLGDPAERGGRQTVLCERGDGRLAVGAAFSLVAANSTPHGDDQRIDL